MAVAEHNIRFKTTIHEDLAEAIKQEAQRQGVAGSQLAAFIVESYFVNRGLYAPTESDPQWKTKLKAAHSAAPPSALAS